MNLDEILAMNLKKYRKKYEISQEELAGRSGMSIRSYGKIERGEVCTSLRMVEKLADGTGLSPIQLLRDNLNLEDE